MQTNFMTARLAPTANLKAQEMEAELDLHSAALDAMQVSAEAALLEAKAEADAYYTSHEVKLATKLDHRQTRLPREGTRLFLQRLNPFQGSSKMMLLKQEDVTRTYFRFEDKQHTTWTDEPGAEHQPFFLERSFQPGDRLDYLAVFPCGIFCRITATQVHAIRRMCQVLGVELEDLTTKKRDRFQVDGSRPHLVPDRLSGLYNGLILEKRTIRREIVSLKGDDIVEYGARFWVMYSDNAVHHPWRNRVVESPYLRQRFSAVQITMRWNKTTNEVYSMAVYPHDRLRKFVRMDKGNLSILDVLGHNSISDNLWNDLGFEELALRRAETMLNEHQCRAMWDELQRVEEQGYFYAGKRQTKLAYLIQVANLPGIIGQREVLEMYSGTYGMNSGFGGKHSRRLISKRWNAARKALNAEGTQGKGKKVLEALVGPLNKKTKQLLEDLKRDRPDHIANVLTVLAHADQYGICPEQKQHITEQFLGPAFFGFRGTHISPMAIEAIAYGERLGRKKGIPHHVMEAHLKLIDRSRQHNPKSPEQLAEKCLDSYRMLLALKKGLRTLTPEAKAMANKLMKPNGYAHVGEYHDALMPLMLMLERENVQLPSEPAALLCMAKEQLLLQTPKTVKELSNLGTTLNNCVSGYSEEVKQKRIKIYGVYTVDGDTVTPLVTISATKRDGQLVLDQYKLKHNQLPNKKSALVQALTVLAALDIRLGSSSDSNTIRNRTRQLQADEFTVQEAPAFDYFKQFEVDANTNASAPMPELLSGEAVAVLLNPPPPMATPLDDEDEDYDYPF